MSCVRQSEGFLFGAQGVKDCVPSTVDFGRMEPVRLLLRSLWRFSAKLHRTSAALGPSRADGR